MNSPIVENLLRHACERAGQPAIVEERRVATFAELAELTRRWAGLLRGRGVGPGDPVLVYVPPSIELYAILLALWWRGAIAVFADAWTTRHRMNDVAKLVRPRLFIGINKAQLLHWLNPALRRLPSQRLGKIHGWTRAPEGVPASIDADQTALVTFTSGTTAAPKGADRSHAFLMTQHDVLLDAFDPPPAGPDLTTLPIFVLHALASGRTSLLAPIPASRPAAHNPKRLLRFMRRYQPVSSQASPAVLETLVDFMARRGLTWNEALALHIGGAAVLPSLMRRLRRAFPSARLTAVYGSTEAEPIALKDGDELANIPTSECRTGLDAGRPYQHTQVAILPIDADRTRPLTAAAWRCRCRPGEAGEILVSGPHVLDRYYGSANDLGLHYKTRNATWLRTGDAGLLDTTGNLKLLGRADDSFTSAGVRHFTLPWQVLLQDLPGVENATLIHAKRRPVICIETRIRSKRHIDKLLATAELPFEFDVWRGRIPRDPRHNSKVDSKRLAELVHA